MRNFIIDWDGYQLAGYQVIPIQTVIINDGKPTPTPTPTLTPPVQTPKGEVSLLLLIKLMQKLAMFLKQHLM
jgi:hypothetical protein